MKIYNTMTRQKEELTPQEGNKFRIYACGPTVYNLIHVGNARMLCVFDLLRRYLEYRGYDVDYIVNFTDIEDKIIRRAAEEGVTCEDITTRYIAEYFTDAEGLGIKKATIHPKATENIDGIIEIVSGLIEKGFAYEAQGDVYFRTEAFAQYGKLSHQPLEDLEAGARVMAGENKQAPMDFALWKAAKPGEPSWQSPWGMGRPGWHIECSAMARRYLGDTIDIHCGGQDLVFPHHENEVAQSECFTGKPLARYWMHNGYINVDNVKMSKSLGNFFTVRDVAAQYGYAPIRYFLIASQYRSPINYNKEVLEQCRASLARLTNCRESLLFFLEKATADESAQDGDIRATLEPRRAQFIAAMEDDLNTADALGAVFALVRDINTDVLKEGASRGLCQFALDLFDELCGVLGIAQPEQETSLDKQMEDLIAQRAQARAEKNWARADEIRDQINAMGVVLEDTPLGVKWHVKS